MISEDRVEKAVEFIRDHADVLGGLVGRCKGLEQERKVVRGKQFLEAKGTVAEREARAESSKEYELIVEEIENSWADKTELETKIRAAELTIEVWRSQNKWGDRGHL